MAMPGKGYVYIFLRADGLRKLGWTTSPPRRRSQLSNATGIAHEHEMTWEMGSRGAHRVEQMVHGALRALRHPFSREVYGVPLAILVEAVEQVMARLSHDDLASMYPWRPPRQIWPAPDWPTLIRDAEEQLRADPDLYRAIIARAGLEVASC